MKPGDLVRDFPDEIERFSPRYGVVLKVTVRDQEEAGSDDIIEVCFGGELEAWDDCDIEVVCEGR